MRRVLRALGLSGIVLAAACAQDVTTSREQRAQPVVAASLAACTTAKSVDYLTASIDSLMKILTPNNQSAQSKFQTILADLAAGNYTQAQTDLQTLINFINLKYSQANTTGVTIKDPETGDPIAILTFKDTLLDNLTCYVQLNSFDLNPNDPPKVFPNPETTAAVWFPQGYVPQGFNVVVTTPASNPLITPLDVWPSFIEIHLVDENGNPPAPGTVFNGKPIVVVCFPADMPVEVAQRALLGHQAAAGFELLPEVSVPQELADAVTCGSQLPIQTTVLGQLVRKAADFLLPAKLHAMFFGVGGVGGSPEEFSPFGAVDAGVSFSAGGSPEEFIKTSKVSAKPQSKTSIPVASLVLPGSIDHVEGTAGEPDVTGSDPRLPKVRIVTQLGNGIDGITVGFKLNPPDASGSDPITGPNSEATICQGITSDSVEVTTSGGGWATLPCLNFGTKVGYKNLRVNFDPTDIDPLACIIKDGACGPSTTSQNFLIETNLAAATLVVGPTTAPLVSVTVGTALQQLKATVADAYANPFGGATVNVSATGLECVGGGTACLSATTDAFGHAFFNNLTRTTAGTVTLNFSSVNSTSATLNATFTAAAATQIVLVSPASGAYGSGLTAFTAVSPNPTVGTRDQYNNPVSANVFWQLVNTTTGASISPAGPWVSNTTTGNASVTWTLGDGSNGLKAYLGTSATGTPVEFTATTAATAQVSLASCGPSGTIKKTDLAKFVSPGYKGYFSFPSKAKALIKTASINMSVTGQSSGTGDYPTTLRAYRQSGTGLGVLLATGKPSTSDQTLKLPGSNSNPTAIPFLMTPSLVVEAGETVIMELQIAAPSTRTFQVWYNTKTLDGSDCYNTKLYTPALTTPNFTTSSFLRGMHLTVINK